MQSASHLATLTAAVTAAEHKADNTALGDTISEGETAAAAPADTAIIFSQDADNAAAVALDPVTESSNMDGAVSNAALDRSASITEAASKDALAAFLAAGAFAGAKSGMVFKHGPQGLGYYLDAMPAGMASAYKAASNLGQKADSKGADLNSHTTALPDAWAADNTALYTGNPPARLRDDSQTHLEQWPTSGDKQLQSGEEEEQTRASQVKAETNDQTAGGGCRKAADNRSQTGHYWPQALQILDCHVQVCV